MKLFRVEISPLARKKDRVGKNPYEPVMNQYQWIVEAESEEEAVEILVRDGICVASATFLVDEVKPIQVSVMGHPASELEGPQ